MDSDGSCHDVNECLDEDVCNGIGTCINLDGGYDCECPAGLFKSKLQGPPYLLERLSKNVTNHPLVQFLDND